MTAGRAPDPDVSRVRTVLLGVRLVGFGSEERIAARSAMGIDETTAVLDWSERHGLVVARRDRFPGWSLTAEGRVHGEQLLAVEVAERDALGTIRDGYRDFLELNARLLALCTAWQLVPQPGGRFETNRHDDPAYDRGVLDELTAVDTAIDPVLASLSAVLDRFGSYRQRLTHARRRVEAGDGDWLTRPVIDSYHTVWFELHEDLLATQGIDRSGERSREH